MTDKTEAKPGIQKFVWQFTGAAVNAVMLAVAVPREDYGTETFYLALASCGLQITSAALTYIVPNLRDAKRLKETVALVFVILQVLVAIIPGGIDSLEWQQVSVAVFSFIATASHSNGPITGSLQDPPVPTVVDQVVPVPLPVPEGMSVQIESVPQEPNHPQTSPIEVPTDGTESREIGGYKFTFLKEN